MVIVPQIKSYLARFRAHSFERALTFRFFSSRPRRIVSVRVAGETEWGGEGGTSFVCKDTRHESGTQILLVPPPPSEYTSRKLHGECEYILTLGVCARRAERRDGCLYQPKRTLRATLNYAGASTRRRYRRKSGHRRRSGWIPQGGGGRDGATRTNAPLILTPSSAQKLRAPRALLNRRGNLPTGGTRRCTEVRCRAR